ncbi:amidohydrolase family protein [Bradyrhizobium icense]|uniref:Amidohydrolase n=1 Tax=Bradyrhizobium icense TaxID=1274631 RepID=A0A1B1UBJ3_9BRAD|nr:amidohydrolase family protein [Bradyrhizobium icense]ANW00124.1 amidohydrolase [Bradyrhizobium icense]
MSAIDVWAQVTTERMARRPWLEPLMRWTGRNSDQLFETTVELTLAAMDDASIDIAILSAWHGPEGSLISNEEVAAQIEVAADRFRGLATVRLDSPMEAVREIRRWVDGTRFVGVRIVPWLWDLPPNHRLYYPIYAACVEADVPFCTQIGHTGPLRRSEVGRLIPYLEDVLLDFPDLVVVGGHVGFPWLDELTTLSIKFPNFYVDTSAYALRRLPSQFVEWMKGVGQTRVMFGTNWPMLHPRQCLQGIDTLGLSETQRAAFLSGNARRVFRL